MRVISIGELCQAAIRSPPESPWKIVAYIGRYAHQPASETLAMTVRERMQVAEAIVEMLEQESPQRG